MLKRVTIKGFQSVSDQTLEFVSGVNILRGENRSGKSAILRAIRSAVTNPRGTKFIRDGARATNVILEFEEGVLEWNKEKTGSGSYHLLVEGKDFDFGKVAGVPVEVEQFLKLGAVKLDEDIEVDLTFSRQLDPLFLVGAKGTYIAKVLGRVSFVNVLQNALRLMNKDLSSLKSNKKELVSVIVDTETSLEGFINLPVLEKTLVEVEELKSVVDKKIVSLDSTSTAITSLSVLFTKIENLTTVSTALSKIDFSAFKLLEGILAEFKEIENDCNTLASVGLRIKSVGKGLEDANTSLETFKGEKIQIESAWSVCPICSRPMEKI